MLETSPLVFLQIFPFLCLSLKQKRFSIASPPKENTVGEPEMKIAVFTPNGTMSRTKSPFFLACALLVFQLFITTVLSVTISCRKTFSESYNVLVVNLLNNWTYWLSLKLYGRCLNG